MTGRSRLLLTLTPGLAVSVLWCAAALPTAAYGPGPCPAPSPCSPDGHCIPKHDTWGWYPTRWRAFPGDAVAPTPTAAETPQATTPETDLRGPQLPDSTKESLIGPSKTEADAAAEGPAAPGTSPAEPPAAEPPADLPGGPLPGVDLPGLPGLPGAEQPPAGGPAPGSDEDPFSALPPAPPWLVEQAEATNDNQPSSIDADVAPAVDFEPVFKDQHDEAPNAHGDDAPPEMPASLMDALTGVPPRHAYSAIPAPGPAAATPNSELAALPVSLPPVAPAMQLAQPKTVVPSQAPMPTQDRRIVPAAATATPDNIQLINPAVALVGNDASQSLDQAVYFEASDMPAGAPVVQHAAP